MSRIKKPISRSPLKTCTVEITSKETLHQRDELPQCGPSAILTPLEECVIRMRQGLSISPDDTLEYKGQNNPETRAKLAFIEHHAMYVMESRESDLARKSRIIEKLKQ